MPGSSSKSGGRDSSGERRLRRFAFVLRGIRVTRDLHRSPVVIGLTGPIGCGKSTVARLLARHGVVVIDADRVAREVTAPGERAHDAILARFGERVQATDGTLDRAALARVVFSDSAALATLESIVHPAVRPRIIEMVEAAEADGAPAVVIEAIKLVEGGLADACDEVWLVTCDPDAQRERLAARGADPYDATSRVAAQGDLAERLRPAATQVIETSGSLGDTEAAVDRLWRELAAAG
jgi:dephospho-CoA kinase